MRDLLNRGSQADSIDRLASCRVWVRSLGRRRNRKKGAPRTGYRLSLPLSFDFARFVL
jgi:hypothetical protein